MTDKAKKTIETLKQIRLNIFSPSESDALRSAIDLIKLMDCGEIIVAGPPIAIVKRIKVLEQIMERYEDGSEELDALKEGCTALMNLACGRYSKPYEPEEETKKPEELPRCPSCGGRARMRNAHGGFVFIECERCGRHTGRHEGTYGMVSGEECALYEWKQQIDILSGKRAKK